MRDVLAEEGFQTLREAGVSPEDVAVAFLGLAGVGRERDRVQVAQMAAQIGLARGVLVDSDARIALAGAFAGEPGIILIAGTGSICYGINEEGEMARSGGWGYLLGDEGSGYFLGQQALIAALKDFDGRGQKTELRPVLEEKFGVENISLIIPAVYSGKISREAIAGLAPLVFDTADRGDAVAREILQRAGLALAGLTRAVAVRLGLTGKLIRLALIGGLFSRKRWFIGPIREELGALSPGVEIVKPQLEPVLGAVLLALQACHITLTKDILRNLSRSS